MPRVSADMVREEAAPRTRGAAAPRLQQHVYRIASEAHMLYWAAVILFALWIIGFAMHIVGGLIHILLVLAIVALAYKWLTREHGRPTT
jgi:hypothetical protein